MQLVGYARAARDRQAEDECAVDVQEKTIRAWARTHGHRLANVYRDEGVYGGEDVDSRRGLLTALSVVRDLSGVNRGWGSVVTEEATPVAGLVVYQLDRLASDLIIQETLLAEVRRIGGQVFTCSDSEADHLTNPEDPGRRLIRQVLGSVAAYEKSVLVQRLRGGGRRRKGRT